MKTTNTNVKKNNRNKQKKVRVSPNRMLKWQNALQDEERATVNFHELQVDAIQPTSNVKVKAAQAEKAIIAAAKDAAAIVKAAPNRPAPLRKPRWQPRGGAPNPRGTNSSSKVTNDSPLLRFTEPTNGNSIGSPVPLATTSISALSHVGANDISGTPVSAAVISGYQNGVSYAHCLLDAHGTPEGVHLPEDGETAICGTRKITQSMAVPVYNGTVGSDGSCAILIRNDPVNTYSVASIDANHLCTFGTSPTTSELSATHSSDWKSMVGSDVTGNYVTRPIVVEAYLTVVGYGLTHSLNGSTRIYPPSSAASSTTSLSFHTNIQPTSAEIAVGAEQKPTGAVCTVKIASWKTRGSIERKTWIGGLTDRDVHAGETKIASIFGLSAQDSAMLYICMHYEHAPNTASVAPLASGVTSGVRPDAAADNLAAVAAEASERHADIIAKTRQDANRSAMSAWGPIQQAFHSQSLWDVGAQIATQLYDKILGGSVFDWGMRAIFDLNISPSLQLARARIAAQRQPTSENVDAALNMQALLQHKRALAQSSLVGSARYPTADEFKAIAANEPSDDEKTVDGFALPKSSESVGGPTPNLTKIPQPLNKQRAQ